MHHRLLNYKLNFNLAKRGWIDDPTCVLFGSEEETVGHLFIRCVFSKFIIAIGVNDILVQDLRDSVNLIMDRWTARKDLQKKRNRLTDLVGCW